MAFVSFNLILLCFSLLAGGAFLLIFGLIKKKPKLWIPGVVISAIMGTLVFTSVIMTIIKEQERRIAQRNNNFDQNYYNDQVPEYEEAVPSESDSVANYLNSDPVSGFVKDAQNQSILIRIFPDNYIAEHGISIISVGDAKSPGKEELIKVSLSFDQDFKGRIMLQFYNADNKEMSYDVIEASQPGNSDLDLEFRTGSNVHFSDISYCVLSAAHY